jgi:hypothetical protein
MKKALQEIFDKIVEQLDAVISDTKTVTRAEAIDFCDEIENWVDATRGER